MTAQKRETGRNYIGLLREETEEQRVADMSRRLRSAVSWITCSAYGDACARE